MAKREHMRDARHENLVLFAWVGEDEMGSGEIGLKQGMTPVGLIPLVAVREDRMSQDFIVEAMKRQAREYGKKIRLCRFKFDKEVKTVP